MSGTGRPARAALAVVALASAGFGPCAVEPIESSEDVSTLDMHLDVRVEDDGTGADLRIRLDGPDGPLRLHPGDDLTARADQAVVPLTEGAQHQLSATLPAAPEEVTVTLDRPGEQESIRIDVPPPFTLLVTRASDDALELAWDATAASYALTVRVEGDCIQGLVRPLAVDTGSYRIDPAELVLAGPGGSCSLDVALTRSASVAPAGEGFRWSSSAIQRRTIAIAWSS